jgi:flagellar biosynthesis protein FlhA
MADIQRTIGRSFLANRTDILVAVGVVTVVMMLIIPLPTVILDLFMTFNIVLSLLVILIVLYVRRALEFSVFPTLLLAATVFGLALNVSSTRLILSQGAQFNGRIVRAFATFVVGTSGAEGMVIGFIIFVIIIAVQFIVITKGSTRVAEVAARFTLDALPGKQMSIDQEYSSGLITEEEATQRKNDLQREVDFYGAMDGASKFVSGNVKVGILITVINIIGGIVVGMSIHGEPVNLALNNYITLAVGDGLVTQFPALLISTSTGIIVTRAISDGTFGQDVATQFSRQAQIYWIAAVFLLVLSVLPGFPWYVLIPMALIIGFAGYILSRREVARADQAATEAAVKPEEAPAEMSPVVPLDTLSLELGYGLVPLVDKDQGAELLDRIQKIRRESALELGLVVPLIRIIDNMRLEPSEYCIKIKGVEVGRGTIRTGHYLCLSPGGAGDELPGEKTVDPTFGMPAIWITEEYRDRAERLGYTVVDGPSIIATHLQELIKRHAYELLGRQEVQGILDALNGEYPAVVTAVKEVLSVGEIQKVLQGLLMEQVSIRNMVPILETLADFAPITKDVWFLIEKSRQTLGRQICLQYADDDKVLRCLTIDPQLEQELIDSRTDTAGGPVAAMKPQMMRRWINAVTNTVRTIHDAGYLPVILCSEEARQLVKRSTLREISSIVVISIPEVPADMKVESRGEITIEE